MVDLAELETDIEAALRDNYLYPAENYGWLNEDEVDPEHVGYAMWWQDPPYESDFEAWQNGTTPRREPSDREQRLMELGADFFGVMKVARHSLGLALLYQPRLSPQRVDVTPFDIHEFAALTGLRAAADRLRDFVITAVHGSKTDDRDQLNRVYEVLSARGFATGVTSLHRHLTAVKDLRHASNVALHNIATEPGQVQRRLIEADRSAYRNGAWPGRRTYASYRHIIREAQAEDREAVAAVNKRVTLLRKSYLHLIEAGHEAFRLEHDSRHDFRRT
jgi:hypothetical protein